MLQNIYIPALQSFVHWVSISPDLRIPSKSIWCIQWTRGHEMVLFSLCLYWLHHRRVNSFDQMTTVLWMINNTWTSGVRKHVIRVCLLSTFFDLRVFAVHYLLNLILPYFMTSGVVRLLSLILLHIFDKNPNHTPRQFLSSKSSAEPCTLPLSFLRMWTVAEWTLEMRTSSIVFYSNMHLSGSLEFHCDKESASI